MSAPLKMHGDPLRRVLSAPVVSARIVYRCRACPLVFDSAKTSNAHHDATGHHQTSRCPTCGRHLSWHTDAEYDVCRASSPSLENPTK